MRGRDRQHGAQRDGRKDCHGLAAIGGQDEGNGLLDVVVDRAPFLHRRCDGGEVVVGEHHFRRFLGRIGALNAHGNADVGALECGGVVYPVAGHGADGAVMLKGGYQPQLVFRRCAGKDVHLSRPGSQIFIGGGVDFGSRHGSIGAG